MIPAIAGAAADVPPTRNTEKFPLASGVQSPSSAQIAYAE
jgi:hypothetical protein